MTESNYFHFKEISSKEINHTFVKYIENIVHLQEIKTPQTTNILIEEQLVKLLKNILKCTSWSCLHCISVASVLETFSRHDLNLSVLYHTFILYQWTSETKRQSHLCIRVFLVQCKCNYCLHSFQVKGLWRTIYHKLLTRKQ